MRSMPPDGPWERGRQLRTHGRGVSSVHWRDGKPAGKLTRHTDTLARVDVLPRTSSPASTVTSMNVPHQMPWLQCWKLKITVWIDTHAIRSAPVARLARVESGCCRQSAHALSRL